MEREEEAVDKKKVVQTGTLTSDENVPTGLSRAGVLNARSMKKHGRTYVFLLHRKGREDLESTSCYLRKLGDIWNRKQL